MDYCCWFTIAGGFVASIVASIVADIAGTIAGGLYYCWWIIIIVMILLLLVFFTVAGGLCGWVIVNSWGQHGGIFTCQKVIRELYRYQARHPTNVFCCLLVFSVGSIALNVSTSNSYARHLSYTATSLCKLVPDSWRFQKEERGKCCPNLNARDCPTSYS